MWQLINQQNKINKYTRNDLVIYLVVSIKTYMIRNESKKHD